MRKTQLEYGVAASNGLLTSYKNTAKRREILFNLTKEQFLELTKQSCYYCGIAPKQKFVGHGRLFGSYVYNGIDRVDNTKGYTPDNCVACCKMCNFAKRNVTQDEFVDWLRRVAQFNYENIS